VDELPAPEFLCVTMYVSDPNALRSYYHDTIRLPVDYEVPGHIAALGPVCIHDPSDGPVNSLRLYFLVDDPTRYAEAASHQDVEGALRTDGNGRSAWETIDPFGNSVVLLARPTRWARLHQLLSG
jgi:hypothetical protein